MVMEITNNYNAYENACAAQKQQETAKQRAVSKQEVSETAATQKKTDVGSGKVGSTAEYMKELSKLAPSVEFRMGSSYATDKTGKTLTIDPKLLEKMQNDPAMEKKMKELIGGVEKMTKILDNYHKAVGFTTVYHHSYIDANGKYSCIAFSVKKDKLNERLRKEAEENAKKQIEKTREDARKKTEQLAEQLQEKADKAKETEKEKEPDITAGPDAPKDNGVAQPDTLQDKAEQMLLEKLNHSDNREIYINDEEMQLIIQASTEDEQGRSDKIKNPVVSGNNFDMQI